MKYGRLTNLIVQSTFCLAFCLASLTALAADKPYSKGSVWAVGYVQVADNKLDDYIENLNNGYYPILNEFIKKGWVTSYKVISVDRNSPDDYNLIILVEYPNWATFDRADEEWEKVVDQVFKSMENREKSDNQREEIRILWGSKIGQELKPKL